MVPCMDSSAYAINTNITCGSPIAQLDRILGSLTTAGMEFVKNPQKTWAPSAKPTFLSATPKPTGQPTGSPSSQPSRRPTMQPSSVPSSQPSSQPSMYPTFLNKNKPTFDPTKRPTRTPTIPPTRRPTRTPTTAYPTPRPTRDPTARPTLNAIIIQHLFILVEDNIPNRYFDINATSNAVYLHELANYAFLKGIKFGISTTKSDWESIYVKERKSKNQLAQTLLWLPRYDGIDSMDFFAPFSGFSHVYMKQTSGGSADLRRIGSDRIGYNYRVDKNELHMNYTNVYALGLP